MKIDLSCTKDNCRGNLGITGNVLKKEYLDKDLAEWGFYRNLNAMVYNVPLFDWLSLKEPAKEGADYLLVHTLNKLEDPLEILKKLNELKPNTVVIIVPNSAEPKQDTDKKEKDNIYSFTVASLKSLLGRAFGGYYLAAKRIANNMDIMVIVSKNPIDTSISKKGSAGRNIGGTLANIGRGTMAFFSQHNILAGQMPPQKKNQPENSQKSI